MTEQNIDPQRQEQAREYASVRRRFLLLDLILGSVLLLIWLLLGWSTSVRDWILTWTSNQWIAVAAFGAIFGGFFYLIDLPLSYYTSYVLPHRYDQSNQTRKGWVGDVLKSALLTALLGGLLLEIIYLMLRSTPETWWLWAGGIIFLFNILLANLAPILIMPLFYDFEPLGENHRQLEERLLNLAEKAGTNVKGVYKFDISRRTKSANAGLTGLGNSRRIILGDTMIDNFSPDEIETVLAHELGHHVNRDIPLGMVFQTVLTLGSLYLVSIFLTWGVNAFGFQGIADIASLPLFGLAMGGFSLITMPMIHSFSRWRERLADRYALQTTGKGQAYASALIRLANQNLAEVDPPRWVELLLMSHPPLKKRIALANPDQAQPELSKN
ncbi:MAG: M48 family metallopeptidase [Anaerolineales bacterium]|nr:M48 family metallopeptidase [Anaerolineales bacterium]